MWNPIAAFNAVFAFLCRLLLIFSLSGTLAAEQHQVSSDHFDGHVFFNPGVDINKTLGEFLRWQFNRETQGEWVWHENPPVQLPPERVKQGIRTQFINHATVLIQLDGINIITDPIFSDRASPLPVVGPQRWHDPALTIEQLPPIDIVLLSHAHYDHFDIASLKALEKHSHPLFIAGLGSEDLFQSMAIDNYELLDWWQASDQALNLAEAGPEVDVIFAPAVHWSNRGLRDRNKRLWGSFVVRGSSGQVYFAGDTGWGEHFQQIQQRFGASDIALLPIGAYLPRWFMAAQHISPDQALQAHRLLGASQSMGIHFGTFALADDGPDTASDEIKELS